MKQKLPILIALICILVWTGCAPVSQTPQAIDPTAAAVQPDDAAEIVEISLETPIPTTAPTPEPVPTLAPTEVPTETPEPTETPTPSPEPLRFTASEDIPLPSEAYPLAKGCPFAIDGLIESVSPLLSVRALVVDRNGSSKLEAQETFDAGQNITEYRLLDLTFSREVSCLSEQLKFEKLAVGSYTLQLYAESVGTGQTLLASADFKVDGSRWIQLQPNNLRGNYTTALAFFGSPERFLFRFKFRSADSTLITVDPEWRDKYDAEAVCVNGKKWRCHVDAVPYFEKVGQYIDNTYIHISGKGLDTGVVHLPDIIDFDATIVRRFVNSGLFVSHHSFGTAVDINAHYPSHRDVLANREKIYHEVHDNLTYNGIVEIKGTKCYDFTYTGHAASGLKKVPEPLMNYLLYELGFYRAGFSWGFYYPHTCDAMHFSLSELSPSYFTEGPYALRKVFSYIDDETPGASDADGSEANESDAG